MMKRSIVISSSFWVIYNIFLHIIFTMLTHSLWQVTNMFTAYTLRNVFDFFADMRRPHWESENHIEGVNYFKDLLCSRILAFAVSANVMWIAGYTRPAVIYFPAEKTVTC